MIFGFGMKAAKWKCMELNDYIILFQDHFESNEMLTEIYSY